jgi:WD40 repeat protein
VTGAARVLSGHAEGTFEGGVKSLDSSGRWLASGGDDGVVRLWDTGSETPAMAGIGLLGHVRPVHSVRFTHDGSQLVSVGDDHTLRVWPVSLDRVIAAACREVGRGLSPEERSRYFATSSEDADACAAE